MHAELTEQVLDVRRNRLLTDHQLLRDLLLSVALDQEVENFQLTAREMRRARLTGHDVADQRLAVDESAHAGDELVGVERLDDEIVRTEQQAGDAVERLGAQTGEEEDRQLVAALA